VEAASTSCTTTRGVWVANQMAHQCSACIAMP
jgi:hypothetical protein